MSNEVFPLFSVIIPQKDRAEYLIHTLRTCMMQDYPNFQVIVSDDCSVDNSVSVVQNLMIIDSRIKLFAHKEHLGMRDNFEFALNQVKEGYVIALGGDDGLLPGCIQRMYEILKETQKELLTWKPATFIYASENGGNNILTVPRNSKNDVKIIKSSDFLNKISKTFRYQIGECPMFYIKGVASIELIKKVKERTADNNFYYCPTPDGFSGVVLAGEVQDYVYAFEPLSIGGTTMKSQGKNYRRTDKKSREEAQQFFNDNIRRTMHKDLASQQYSPLVTLMTADYLLTAKDLPGWPGCFNEISFENLLQETFKLLEKSYFDRLVLDRELEILKQIAMQHDLLELYNNLLQNTAIKKNEDFPIYGLAITNSLRFEGAELNIHNIFDASICVNFIWNFKKKISLKSLAEVFVNNVVILLRSRFYRKEKLIKKHNSI